MPAPSLSRVRAWHGEYLLEAAHTLEAVETQWTGVYDELHMQVQRPAGTAWCGGTATAAVARVTSDRRQILEAHSTLTSAANVARAGADELQLARSDVLRAVGAAEENGFAVGDDYAVTSRVVATASNQALRRIAAETFAADIESKVVRLAAIDQEVADQLTAATVALHSLTFGEPSTERQPSIQLYTDLFPLPERPKFEPKPPPGGWSEEPVKRAAQKIAYGHAWVQHSKQFPTIGQDQLSGIVDSMFRRAGQDGHGLIVGRTIDGAPALYDPRTNIMVIRDAKALDAGTVFKVTMKDLNSYIDGKIPQRLPVLPLQNFADGASLPKAAPQEPRPAPRVAGVPGTPQLIEPSNTIADNELPTLGASPQDQDQDQDQDPGLKP